MKKNMLYTFNRIVMTVVFFLMTSVFAQAQNYFIGTTGNRLWSDADNWLNGEKPNEDCSEVIIRADVLVDENVIIPTLVDDVPCSLTIQEGKKMTVTVSIVWDDGGDFILEDGAQLINNDPIQATVKKKIAAQDADNHLWNLIASPVMEEVTPSADNGFLTDPETGYALYAHDAEHLTWIDFKEEAFTLTNGKGYLYANALDTILTYTGTIRGNLSATEIELTYYPNNGNLAGCNFVGNPLPCNAFVSKSYFVFDEESNCLRAVANSSQTTIAPCTGLLLEAKAENDHVFFSSNENLLVASNKGYLEITAAKSNAQNQILDQALLSFNPDDDLAKYAFFENSPQVYFTKDDKNLAILSIDNIDMQPLKFKAEENRTYILHFELKDLNLDYLHLIDNITGANVNLLTTPNYTFNASTSDYTSRFKLVFDPHYGVEEYEHQEFAYYADGEIRLVTDANAVSLQVIDMTGRVVSVGGHTRCVPTNGIPAGVYVLRLSTHHGIQVQKIVIQ